jgi:hypothetical protein
VSPYLDFDLLVAKQGHQVGNDARVNDHLNLLVASVRQVGQSPHRVHQDLQGSKVPKTKYSLSFINTCIIYQYLFVAIKWGGKNINIINVNVLLFGLSLSGYHHGIRNTHINISVVDQHTESWKNLREKNEGESKIVNEGDANNMTGIGYSHYGCDNLDNV